MVYNNTDLEYAEKLEAELRDLAQDPEIDMYGIAELQKEFEVAADLIKKMSEELVSLREERLQAMDMIKKSAITLASIESKLEKLDDLVREDISDRERGFAFE